MDESAKRSWLSYLAALIWVACLGYWIHWSWSFPLHDFANTYFSAYFFKHGSFDIGVFDPYTFNKKIADAGFSGVFASFNPNPPFVAWFFFPFVWLQPMPAKMAFTLATGMLFLISILRLASTLSLNRWLVLMAIPVLFFLPLRNQVLFGQTYFLLTALLIEGFLAYEKKNLWVASMLWSVAIFIKVFPLILFLWLAIRKDWKAFAFLGTACVVLLSASLLIQGPALWLTYFFDVLPPHQQGYISSEYTPYQSMYMFLKYSMVSEPLLNPNPIIDNAWLMSICLALFSTLCLIIICSFTSTTKSVISFSAVLAGSLLLSPYSSTYSLLLLIPLWMILTKELRTPWAIAVSLVVFSISNIPMGTFQSWGLLFPRLGLIIILFIGCVFFLRAKLQWVYFLFLLPLAAPTILKGASEADGQRVLADEDEILIFDFAVDKGKLIYSYWSEEGAQIKETDWEVTTATDDGVMVNDQQIIWNGTKITHSASHKLKPMLINGDTVVFLSDYHKGRGFYTLRFVRISNER